jgi:hypothetical protein
MVAVLSQIMTATGTIGARSMSQSREPIRTPPPAKPPRRESASTAAGLAAQRAAFAERERRRAADRLEQPPEPAPAAGSFARSPV